MLLLLTVSMYTMLSTTNNQNIQYLVASFDCTSWISYSLLQRIGTIALDNTTADISVEDQLQPPLDMVK